MLNGGENPINTGFSQLFAFNALNESQSILKGAPNGSLEWNTNDLAGAAIVAKSLTTNGYIKYANGLIIQWTREIIPTGKSIVDVNTPIAYPDRHIQAFSSISVNLSAGTFILQLFPSLDSAKHLNTITLQISPRVPSGIDGITVLVVSFGW